MTSRTAVVVERRGRGEVIRPSFDGQAHRALDLTDDLFDAGWEQPVQATIAALQSAFERRIKRIVVVVPTTALSGGAQYAHVAAPAEAIRVMAISAARQWGVHGVTVNVVAVDPATLAIDTGTAGPTSLVPGALAAGADESALIEFLCSDAGGDVTGQTICVDGGVWM